MKKILCILLILTLSSAFFACDTRPFIPPDIIITTVDDVVDDGDVEVDTTNFDTPETGFVMDGVIDATEAQKYNTLGQKLGVEGQVVFSYYIGDKGLYFHFDVNDPIVFRANENENEAGSHDYKMESDRVELFLDSKYDLGSSPKSDDFHLLVTLEGYYIVNRGNGSAWATDSRQGIDAVGSRIKEGTTVSVRDKNAETNPQSSRNVDPGYEVEFFISYKNFDFSKLSTYGLSVGQADEWSVVLERRFNVAGSNLMPSEFRTLSVHGLGTKVALERNIKIDAQKDSYYTEANAASDPFLHRFTATRDWGQTRGPMSVETYVYLGENGVYIYMHAESSYLRYYYADFPYFSDHVEIRIDSNNNENSDASVSGDRWFFTDILGAQQTAFGINNAGRTAGAFDLVATTAYTGELVDSQGVPTKNIGSTDPKTFTFEVFFPYYAINVARGATFGMILECGNPNEGSCGIGNVFYPDPDYSKTAHWHTFEQYSYYTKFTTPA